MTHCYLCRQILKFAVPATKMYSTGINNNAALVLVLLAAAMAALTVLAGSGQAANIPPPHCNPEVADALPPRLRRICAALYGMAEISNAVEQYLDDKSEPRHLKNG